MPRNLNRTHRLDREEWAGVLVLVWLAGALLAFAGWVLNLIYLVTYEGGFSINILLRIAGVFAVPLGALMGWLG
jgi:hypothetical protein